MFFQKIQTEVFFQTRAQWACDFVAAGGAGAATEADAEGTGVEERGRLRNGRGRFCRALEETGEAEGLGDLITQRCTH